MFLPYLRHHALLVVLENRTLDMQSLAAADINYANFVEATIAFDVESPSIYTDAFLGPNYTDAFLGPNAAN